LIGMKAPLRCVLSLSLAALVVQALGASLQNPSSEAATTKNDVLAGALWRLAVDFNARIGFEALDHVRIADRLQDSPTRGVASLEGGLNAAVDADDRYAWRRVDDVIVVRPKRAWGDPTNPFNRPVRDVKVENAGSGSVLLGIRNLVYTNTFAVVDPKVGGIAPIAVSFEVQAGTLVNVLNALTTAADQSLWIASYRPLGTSAERWPNWDLTLELRGRRHLTDFSGSHARMLGRPPH
jgi:hypothetical protein